MDGAFVGAVNMIITRHIIVHYRAHIDGETPYTPGEIQACIRRAEETAGFIDAVIFLIGIAVKASVPGRMDIVFPLNESVHRELEQHGIPVVYETWPGEHNWDFWDAHIQDALRFLNG